MSSPHSWWKVSLLVGFAGAIAISAYSLGLASKVPSPATQAANFLEQGLQLRSAGQPSAALQAFDQAIALKPDYAEAYTAKGALLAKQGQTVEAIAAFNQAIEAEPGLAAPYLGWSQLLVQQGKLVEAKAILNQARTALKQQGNTQQTHVMQALLPNS